MSDIGEVHVSPFFVPRIHRQLGTSVYDIQRGTYVVGYGEYDMFSRLEQFVVLFNDFTHFYFLYRLEKPLHIDPFGQTRLTTLGHDMIDP